MENKQTMIEVQNLCKSFHKLEVLKDISTTFYKNEVVSIIGPSGGGKSTFLRCLNLLEKPDGEGSLQRARRIKKELGELVPSYMVPRRIIAVDSFPLNTNGKIDKKQLRALRAT